MGGLLTIQERTLAVETGGEGVCTLRVRNTGAVVDQFSVQVLGPAAAWTVAEPALLSLFPGTDGEIVLRMRPTVAQAAGAVPFGVKLNSAVDPASTVVEEGVVEVGAFVAVTARLVPRTAKGRGSGKHRLVLRNTGNTPTAVSVTGSDPDDVVKFKGMGGPVRLAAGGRHEMRIRYRSTANHMTGPPELHGFTLSVVPQGGAPVPVEGSFRQKPAVSGWMMAAAGGAVVLIALVLVLKALQHPAELTTGLAKAPVDATPTPAASAAAPAATPTPGAPTPSPAAGAAGGAGAAGAAGGAGGAGGAAGGSGGSGALGGNGSPIGGGSGASGGGSKPSAAAPTPVPTPFALAAAPFTFVHFDGSMHVHVVAAGTDKNIIDNAVSPSWSPNGTSLVYVNTSSNAIDSGSYNATSGSFTAASGDLVSSECPCTLPSWSPDGHFVAFVNKNGDLRTILAGGGSPPQTLAAAVKPTAVTWTPNSTEVVYGTASGIFHVSRSGGAPQALIPSATNVDGVSFKPDATMITWSSGPNTSTHSVYAASISPQLVVSGTATVAGTGHSPHFARSQNLVDYAAPSSNGSGQDDVWSATPAGASATDATPSGSQASAATPTTYSCGYYYNGQCQYYRANPGSPPHFNYQPEG